MTLTVSAAQKCISVKWNDTNGCQAQRLIFAKFILKLRLNINRTQAAERAENSVFTFMVTLTFDL